MNTEIRTVCFTGHRNIEKRDAVAMPSKLKAVIENLIKRGAVSFRTGGAMGFDTVAALCVLELREKYPHISLDLILPCKNQAERWSPENTRVYLYVIKNASSVSYVAEQYHAGCMHERNRRLVDSSDVCVAYCKKSSGGTAYTLSYAEGRKIEIINLCNRL